MTSIVSSKSTAAPPTATVDLRRDYGSIGNFRRPPTVRSLVLSEMFIPLEKSSSFPSERSRSACRSCLLLEPTTTDPTPLTASTKTCRTRKKNNSTLIHRSDSILSKLQSLFLIKRPCVPCIKPEKPQIQSPLVSYDSFTTHIRGCSQSSASRNHHCSKKNSSQASPVHSVEDEPFVYSTPSPKLSVTSTSLSSFVSSPAAIQRPKNLPFVQRRKRNPALPTASAVPQKHLSAHLPREVLPNPLSSSLWSTSSVTSLNTPLHRSSTVRPTTAVAASTKSHIRLQQYSPSVSSIDSAAVNLQRHSRSKSSSHYSSVYVSSSNRIYDEVAPPSTVMPPSLTEKTPTTSKPSHHPEDRALARFGSTTTLTSLEAKAEPSYATTPQSISSILSGNSTPPTPPRLHPPRSNLGSNTMDTKNSLHSTTSPALTPSPQPAILAEPLLHRRTASALRVSYTVSPRFDEPLRGRRPASTVSSSDSTTTTTAGSSSSSWYADILPYKPSTIPETLADRLRQHNSFILSTPAQPCEDLMTRSLFEPRQPSESGIRLVPSRSTSRTRPVSFHDASSTAINLPSLEHLLKPSDSRKAYQMPPEIVSPLNGRLLLQKPLRVQPSDSPLLGQYCRLKLVIPSSSPSNTADLLPSGVKVGPRPS